MGLLGEHLLYSSRMGTGPTHTRCRETPPGRTHRCLDPPVGRESARSSRLRLAVSSMRESSNRGHRAASQLRAHPACLGRESCRKPQTLQSHRPWPSASPMTGPRTCPHPQGAWRLPRRSMKCRDAACETRWEDRQHTRIWAPTTGTDQFPIDSRIGVRRPCRTRLRSGGHPHHHWLSQ